MLGLIVALVGIFLAHYYNGPYLDDSASVLIGVILTAVAGFLIYESKYSLSAKALIRIR